MQAERVGVVDRWQIAKNSPKVLNSTPQHFCVLMECFRKFKRTCGVGRSQLARSQSRRRVLPLSQRLEMEKSADGQVTDSSIKTRPSSLVYPLLL